MSEVPLYLLEVLVVSGVEDSAVDRDRAEARCVLAHVQVLQQRAHLCVCVCVCVREREKERERECVCVCECVCVYACVSV